MIMTMTVSKTKIMTMVATTTMTESITINIAKIFKQVQKDNFYLTVCSYHVTYAFQSESTLYSCLNVKELLARSRREI